MVSYLVSVFSEGGLLPIADENNSEIRKYVKESLKSYRDNGGWHLLEKMQDISDAAGIDVMVSFFADTFLMSI